MPRCLLFAGPSLPDAGDLVGDSGIEVLPPVAAGDLLRLSLGAGDVAGIVDGYFHQVGAVRHKEILALLGAGSGFSALRVWARFARQVGLFWDGRDWGIYADYRAGRLAADDEVTLLHSTAEEEYRALSEPLVCMRATLSRAVEDGVCGSDTAARVIATLAGWPFGRRSYDGLVAAGREAGLDGEAVREIRRYCVTHRRDPKREDALLLLDVLHRASSGETSAPREKPAVNRTSFLHLWQVGASGLGIGDSSHQGDLGVLRACQLFAPGYPRLHREMVFEVLATACAEECGAGAPDTGLAETAVRHGEHRGLYRLPADPARLGFLEQWVTRTERDTLTPPERLATFLVRSFRVRPGLTRDELAIQRLRDRPFWTEARRVVELAWEVNDRVFAEHQHRDLNDLAPEKILGLFAGLWGVTRDDLELAAMDRGLDSLDSLTMAGRAFYLLARYNPDLVGLDAR